MDQGITFWYLGAVALGLMFALVTIGIFLKVAPMGATREYWSHVGDHIHGLIHGQIEQFWVHYLGIVQRTLKFVGIQLLAVVLAFTPLVATFYLAAPWLSARWDENAPFVVMPAAAGNLIVAAEGDANRILALSNGSRVVLPYAPGSVVLCRADSFSCVVLQGFGFTKVTNENLSKDADPIIIRTAHDDWNPAWPYLSDPEFLFFVSLSVGSVFPFVRKRRTPETAPRYGISLVDYVLTNVATSTIGFMNKLGDWETKVYRRRLATLPVTKPIFVTGLARSGTTILLEKLSSVSGIATHQYRDFPFVMTPIIWNKFVNLFSAKQAPVERPHKDGISITRDSPEAFEEPIWQHFFPMLHDPAASHRLGPGTENARFAKFFREHMQKILLIRHGSRYLSKGNYNLTRIEYIAAMFPDARFVVPVRHPVAHVESLMRQHRLFTHHAEDDPKVPAYLQAVGHYEFGPQRLPISPGFNTGHAIVSAWNRGDDALGYARQWCAVYGFVAEVRRDTSLSERILVVRFEDLCCRPRDVLAKILAFLELEAQVDLLAEGIEAPPRRSSLSDEEAAVCWQAASEIAVSYGYSATEAELSAVTI